MNLGFYQNVPLFKEEHCKVLAIYIISIFCTAGSKMALTLYMMCNLLLHIKMHKKQFLHSSFLNKYKNKKEQVDVFVIQISYFIDFLP